MATDERKSITIPFFPTEYSLYDKFEQEALNKGTSKTNYAKTIILNYDNRKRIVLEASIETIKQRYEGVIEILQDQLDDSTKRLAILHEQVNISKQEKEEKNVQDQIQAGIESLRNESLIEKQNKENTKLREELTKITAKLSKLEEEYKKLKQEYKTVRGQLSGIDLAERFAPALANGLVTKIPTLGKIIEKGLNGIANPSKEIISGQEKQFLKFGQEFYNKFSDDERKKMAIIINFLAINKQLMDTQVELIKQVISKNTQTNNEELNN